jgi:hypothetical protein
VTREERLQAFVERNRMELIHAINAAVYRYDGNGGRGTIPRPEPSYDDDEIAQWVDNDEGLYRWALAEGVGDPE